MLAPNWKNDGGSELRRRLGSPAVLLGMALVASAVAAMLPERLVAPARDAVATALRPAQRAARSARGTAASAASWTRSHFRHSARLAEAEAELARLRDENARLAAEVAVAGRLAASVRSSADDDPLLRGSLVPARVLGRQARAYLAERAWLDLGTADGVAPDALVVDAVPVLDRGDDARLAAGQLVLTGRRVWGKVAQLGKNSCTVAKATAPGFRDLVELVDPALPATDPARRPRGLLEGAGERLARVRRVEVTEPVAVGDLVCAASAAGLVDVPLVYGRVVRVEQPVGAAYWDIWMEPAVVAEPERVGVLRIDANPARLAERREGLGIRD